MLSTAERLRGFMVRRGEAIAWFSLDRSVAAMRQAIDLGRAERSARAVVA